MTFESIEAFVKASGGTTPIHKVLIANNGIAAVKEMRSVRQWAYDQFGRERTVSFVVMATPEDLRANAEYIRMADHFEPVRCVVPPRKHRCARVGIVVSTRR